MTTHANTILVNRRTRMRVTELCLSDCNPRSISTSRFENLKRSLERDREFLEARPLLVNSYPGRENVVVAGNMRLRAAQELGWDEVPVLVVSVPPEIEAQWNLKDNNQWGSYVDDDVAALLADLASKGTDVSLLGFDANELERLLAAGSEPPTDENFDPTPPAEARTRVGDLLLLGPHRVVCGDSRDSRTWERLMGTAARADALWTDPPYGVDLAGSALPSRGKAEDLFIQGDQPHELAPLLAAVFPHADQWLKPGAPFYISGPHGRMAVPFIEEIERVGWHLAQTLVWVKNAFVPGRADYHYQHEAVFYGWRPGQPHVWLRSSDKATVMDDEPDLTAMDRRQLLALVQELRNARTTDVIRAEKTHHNDLHPTMKPTGLIRTLLANSTRRGDVVLDPFAGSGSTVVAAHSIGRRAAAIELEPRYCDVMVRRWLALDPTNRADRIRDGARRPVTADG